MQEGGFSDPEDFLGEGAENSQLAQRAHARRVSVGLSTRRLVLWLMVTALLAGIFGYEIGRQSGRGTLAGDGDPARLPAQNSAAPAPGASTTSATDPPSTSPTPSAEGSETLAMALPAQRYIDLLATLEVKGRAPSTGYDRLNFGEAWLDVDGNGCDTRNDILRRDLDALAFRSGTGACIVESGRLDDPYTGTMIQFERGSETSAQVQIDHVVPLADAWVKGARQWTDAKREAFANDPRNLLAVDGTANQQKGAGDAATWLPANRKFWCDYAADIVVVKAAYGVWTTQAENERLDQLLHNCQQATDSST